MSHRIVSLIIVLFCAVATSAAPARRGWTKIEIVPVGAQGSAAAAELLSRFGGELVADYGEFSIASVPHVALATLTSVARDGNVRVRQLDELDVL